MGDQPTGILGAGIRLTVDLSAIMRHACPRLIGTTSTKAVETAAAWHSFAPQPSLDRPLMERADCFTGGASLQGCTAQKETGCTSTISATTPKALANSSRHIHSALCDLAPVV